MNITNETIQELSKLFIFSFYDDFYNEVNPDEAIELAIHFEINENGDPVNYISKAIKATKKETTINYILNKINSDNVYKTFVNDFKKLLPDKYKNSINVYPTSYGIGIFVLFSFNGDKSKIKNEIDNILNNLDIKYKNEYSDAGWVFRYKISKSKENIKKIQQIN